MKILDLQDFRIENTIICFRGFLIFSRPRQQIEPHPTSWQYVPFNKLPWWNWLWLCSFFRSFFHSLHRIKDQDQHFATMIQCPEFFRTSLKLGRIALGLQYSRSWAPSISFRPASLLIVNLRSFVVLPSWLDKFSFWFQISPNPNAKSSKSSCQNFLVWRFVIDWRNVFFCVNWICFKHLKKLIWRTAYF